MSDRKLSLAALGLGIAGLFTGGLLGCGSLVGVLLAVTALVLRRKSPHQGGRELAWAALAANVFALLSIVPLILLGVALSPVAQHAYDTSMFGDKLPEPASAVPAPFVEPAQEAPPPPPPPPPSSHSSTPAAAPAPRSKPTARPAEKATRPEAPAADERPPGPVRVGGDIREPHKLKTVQPVYPEIARQARVQGVVILEVTIGRRGEITDVKVLRGIPLLDHAAVEAVKQWVYTPTLLDGRPVPVILTVTVSFRLSGE